MFLLPKLVRLTYRDTCTWCFFFAIYYYPPYIILLVGPPLCGLFLYELIISTIIQLLPMLKPSSPSPSSFFPPAPPYMISQVRPAYATSSSRNLPAPPQDSQRIMDPAPAKRWSQKRNFSAPRKLPKTARCPSSPSSEATVAGPHQAGLTL